MALGKAEEIWVRHRDWDGTIRDEFRPLNPVWELKNNEPHTISYDISLAEPTMRWGFIGPKRTTWELWVGDIFVTAGIHSYLGTKRGEEVCHVQGLGWLWYLQNRHYPFNGLNPNQFLHLEGVTSSQPGYAYIADKDPALIITDLLDITLARPNSLDFTYSLDPVGVHHVFTVELADTTSLFDMINNFAEAEPGGFDFYATRDREFRMAAPSVYRENGIDFPTDPANTLWVFDHNIHPELLTESEFENNGPEGTHIMGMATGTASQMVRSYGADGTNQQIFKRWDMTVEFPDVTTERQLVNRTQAHFSRGLYPQHNLPITVKADEIDQFWIIFTPGDVIWLRQNYEAQNIDGAYIMDTIRGHANSQGEVIAEIEVEQANPTGAPGTEQG